MPSNDSFSDSGKLVDACRLIGPQLTGCVTHNGQPIDGPLLLWAISGNESGFGRMSQFARHEPAYMPNGIYYKRSPLLRSLWQLYGVLAACSFGAFQIMYVTAVEMGFKGHPIRLQQHDLCAQAAASLILKRFVQGHGATTLAQVLDSYNSGNSFDANIPEDYIRNGIKHYEAGWPDSVRA